MRPASTRKLTFTSANWNVAQSVSVKGVDDTVKDGNIVYTIITGDAVSADAGYNGLVVADVSATNVDNEKGGGGGGGNGGGKPPKKAPDLTSQAVLAELAAAFQAAHRRAAQAAPLAAAKPLDLSWLNKKNS